MFWNSEQAASIAASGSAAGITAFSHFSTPLFDDDCGSGSRRDGHISSLNVVVDTLSALRSCPAICTVILLLGSGLRSGRHLRIAGARHKFGE